MEMPQSSSGSNEEGSCKPPLSTPAYFVILQQSQGVDGKEEGILVANRDLSSVAPVMSSGTDKSKSKVFLSADCTSGNVTVTLDNNNMWNEFYHRSTEMVLTKQGRRMFPYCRYWLSGLDSNRKYILVMDITPMDNHRYKWNGKSWEPIGKSLPHVLGRVFIHPESPSTGHYWMHQPVSFYKLKLTNNILDSDGHIILHSMHRYLPRLHVVPANAATEVIRLNGPDVHTFTFPQTEFIAVTAYQNFQITQLKIDCNPFARGFREAPVCGRPSKDTKPKSTDEEADSAENKKQVEHDHPESIRKLREVFKVSECSSVNADNEAFGAECDFLNFLNPQPACSNLLEQKDDNVDSCDKSSNESSPEEHKDQTNVIKEEPDDDYDYDKVMPTKPVAVKQESSDEEVTDEYSNSDDDYPILQKQFAQFRAETRRERKRSHSSPSGVAKAKLLKLQSEKMPMVCLGQSKGPDLQDPMLSSQDLYRILSSVQKKHDMAASSVNTPETDIDVPKRNNEPSLSNVDCNTPEDNEIETQVSCVSKKKLPLFIHKTQNAGVEKISPPRVKSKRGRPRKSKTKTRRYSKKSSPVESSQFQDVHPDLEDVEGVLFVAFASKEALDLHTGGTTNKDAQSSFLVSPTSKEEKDELQKISRLQKQLVADLQTMRHRQVIHPALQQVGLKLTIVDRTVGIDLRYLGVQLPLPPITSNSRWDNYGMCAQASGFPFVSRTGKTTDYTKIKGWRDKFSTASASSLKNEGSNSENPLKNRSAFCSDELDEYLENEAKLMENSREYYPEESKPAIAYQLPTKSTSYVRTLDSVLKKQASEPSPSSVKPLSAKKQSKTQRKVSTPKIKSKSKPNMPSPVIEKDNPTPSDSIEKSGKLSTDQVADGLMPGLRKPKTPNQKTGTKPSVKSKPASKSIRKQAASCKREFCRLGCVCQSLSRKRTNCNHCRRVECMFSCTCPKSKLSLKSANKPSSSKNCSKESIAGEGSPSQSYSEKMDTKNNCDPKLKPPKRVPIWDKSDIDCDPEPYFTRIKEELDESKIETPNPEEEALPSNSACLSSPEIHIEDMDPDCSETDSRESCARVRIYERKPPQTRPDKEECTCVESEDSEKEYVHKPPKYRSKQKEKKKDEANKRPENAGPTKLIEIISDCSWEQDRSKILNIVSQHMNSRETRSFKVGSFNIELTSENKPEDAGDKSEAIAHSSRVKISMAPDQRKEHCSEKHPTRKWTTERVKLREQTSLESFVERAPSHGAKGLPFYTKIVPAGKLVANLKGSDVNPVELIQVNGKNYPQAKLLLGQMGALHPANRLAAYITHRLQPSLHNVLKLNELNAQIPTDITLPTLCDEDGSSKDSPSAAQNVDNSPHKKSATQPSPSSVFTQFVLNEVENLKQKSPSVISTHLSSKPNTAASQLLVVTTLASSKQTSVVCTTPSLSMPRLFSPPHTSPAKSSSTALALQEQAKTPVPTLIKIITNNKSTSPSSSTTKTTDSTRPLSVPSIIPAIESPPPLLAMPLAKVPSSSVKTSTLPPLSGKTIGTRSAASYTTCASSIKLGSVAPQVGNVLPTLTLRPVSQLPRTQLPRPILVPPAMEKRMGPRLLLIPVQSSTPPVRPAPCPPPSPGQKMILQPIKRPGGTNLFRHPNGQIIQLVPLQQFRATGVVPNNQNKVVLRSPGSVVGIRLPLPVKTESVPIPSSPTVVMSSPVSISTSPVIGSLSKTNPGSSEVTAATSSPSFLSQLGTLRFRIAPPATSSERQQSNSKVITYSCGGEPGNASKGVPLQSGSFALIQIPAQGTASSSKSNNDNNSSVANNTINTDNVTSSDSGEGHKPAEDNSNTVESTTSETKMENDAMGFEDLPSLNVVETDTLSVDQVKDDETASIAVEQPDIAKSSLEIHNGKYGSGDEQQSLGLSSKTKDPEDAAEELEHIDGLSLQGHVETHSQSHETSSKTKDPENAAEELDHIDGLSFQGHVETHSQSHETSSKTKDPENAAEELDHIDGLSLQEHVETNSQSHETSSKTKGPEDAPAEPKLAVGLPLQECEETNSQSHETSSKTKNLDDAPVEPKLTDELPLQEHFETNSQGHKMFPKTKSPEDAAVEPKLADGLPLQEHVETKSQRLEVSSKTKGPEDVDIKRKRTNDFPLQEYVETKSHLESTSGPNVTQILPCTETQEQDANSEPSEVAANVGPQAPDISSTPPEDSSTIEYVKKYTDNNSQKEPIVDNKETDSDSWKDLQLTDFIKNDSHSEADASDVEEAVDIETVEELSEKINIARLKASACSSKDKCGAHDDFSKGRRKCFKKGNPSFMREYDEDATSYYRRTHTANERRRRNEMRDLFEELKNSLGLHNLPKVSKSYILKQAIEEIEGLTDQADKLIRKKTLLSQRQNQLIKRVSNLSGRPQEVVLKKLEYIYAKQKALEVERKKQHLEEDVALREASLMCNPSLLPNPKRKHMPIAPKPETSPAESDQPSVSIRTTNLLVSPEGQLFSLKDPIIASPVASEMNPIVPAKAQPGMAPVLIRFPGTIQVKSLIGNTPSSLPGNALAEPSSQDADKDDLSMMPKIVNVTSLATEVSMDFDGEIEKHPILADESRKTGLQGIKADEPVSRLELEAPTSPSGLPLPGSSSVNVPELPDSTRDIPGPSFVKDFSVNDLRDSEEYENAAESEQDPSLTNVSKGNREDSLDLELKKMSSVIEGTGLVPSELIDVIGDHEDSDETLTSLLNEIAFLNQSLNNDTDELDSGPDLSGSDTGSRGNASKLLDRDSSPFSFGMEPSEVKEKVSLSPLFLHLENSELQETDKESKVSGVVEFCNESKTKTLPAADKVFGLQEDSPNPSSQETMTRPESSGTEAWWRPMPKLAPLGLKSSNLSADQKVVTSKAMPSLSPVLRLQSPKTELAPAAVTLSSKTEN
ncbi:MAX gene-associated protein [Spea bombifrons]|uniref:MAX gene-associated protein n=1 Tax=Spea bombifrons TaxID=233779 RepID=UPI0023491356|nr:MAX gene-associated protein [Spea bombifrons]